MLTEEVLVFRYRWGLLRKEGGKPSTPLWDQRCWLSLCDTFRTL